MSLNGTVWAPVGPSPINEGGITANGQVTAIAINPNNSNIIYIGTAWGGVWLTRDGGDTWTPIFDRAPSLGVGDPGALAIDPIDTNILYVGTTSREGSEFSGEATQPPAGLFKSTDGGASWIRLGSGYPPGPPSNASIFFSQLITVVIVDPVNNQTLYLASNAGLFVSTDGGLKWTQGVAPAGDVRSLVLDATSPAAARILYAGITGVGVVQSTDGGLNWNTTVLSGATAAVSTELSTAGIPGPARSVGKFVVALAPPTPSPNPAGIQVLYASIEGRPVNRPPLPTDAPRSHRGLQERRSGQDLDAADSPQRGHSAGLRHAAYHAVRVQFSYGCRSRLARRRDQRHPLFRRDASGEVHRFGPDLHAADGTPCRHACLGVFASAGSLLRRLFRQRRRVLQPNQRHDLHVSQRRRNGRRCSTTSTSRKTRRRA